MDTCDLMDPFDARNVLRSAELDDTDQIDVRGVIAAGLSLNHEVHRLTRELELMLARTRSDGSENAVTTRVEGGPLVEDRDSGGLRHFLSGRPVHAGDGLYLLTQLGWMPGRYEWGFRAGTPCNIYFSLPGVHEATAVQIPSGAQLAWPDEIVGD